MRLVFLLRKSSMRREYLQWIEIDKQALIHNIHQFGKLAGNPGKVMGIVKANAYGHGILEISKIVLNEGIEWLGVHSLEEGTCLRKTGLEGPILILGYVALKDLEEAVIQDLRLTVYNPETVDRLAEICHRLQRKVNLHLKVETGTYRQGIREEDVVSFFNKAKKYPGVTIEGISSHFSNIEDTTDHSYARFQHENYKSLLQVLEKNHFKVPMRHMSCSAAAILFPETYFDMVRVGIGMYGLWPSKETYLSCLMEKRKPLLLKSVLSWKTRVAQIKQVPQGAYIGYGCTYKTTRDTLLAVLPIGYSDGYNRSLSNSAYVLIKGQRAPLRGRVAMNFVVVDVTDIRGVILEEEAVLIGKDGDESISADDLASLVGSINYEIVSRINSKIPRVMV